MAKTGTDRRVRDMDPCPAAKRAARGAVAVIARAEVRAALALTRIREKRGHAFDKKKSLKSWAVAQGYGPQQVHRLMGLGRALRLVRSLVGRVRRLEVCAESAVWIGKLFTEKALDLDDAQKALWLELAGSMDPTAFKEAACKAIDDARQGEATHSMQLWVTRKTFDGFQRVRLILSKGQIKQVTEGEALGHLVEYWRLRNDPRVAPLPKRGKTRGGKGRYRSRRDEAEVRRECGDTCDICRDARAVHFMHVGTPYGKGGGQSAEELTQGCADCHFFVDRGIWVYDGRDETGRRRWKYNPDWDKPMRDRAARDAADAKGRRGGEEPDPPPDDASVRERPPPYLVHLRLPGRPHRAWA